MRKPWRGWAVVRGDIWMIRAGCFTEVDPGLPVYMGDRIVEVEIREVVKKRARAVHFTEDGR